MEGKEQDTKHMNESQGDLLAKFLEADHSAGDQSSPEERPAQQRAAHHDPVNDQIMQIAGDKNPLNLEVQHIIVMVPDRTAHMIKDHKVSRQTEELPGRHQSLGYRARLLWSTYVTNNLYRQRSA